MKYLIATDGSPNANACVQYLSSIKLADDDLVKVLTVWDANPYRVLPARLNKEEAESLLAETVKGLTIVFGERVTGACIQGEVAASIMQAAQRWQADKTLLGAHARTDLPEALIGNIAREILHNSTKSVLIFRYRQDEDIKNDRKKILCCVDNIPFSESVFADLPLGAELKFFHVSEHVGPSSASQKIAGSVNSNKEALIDSTIQRFMDEHIEKIRRCRPDLITYSKIVAEINPCEAILSYAKQWQTDLIITKSHKYTHSERILLGSVSEEIANKAYCSVEVIR